jgi:hypothetical protein
MNRRILAVIALAALVFLAGCSALGGDDIDEDDLLENRTYQWDSNTTAVYNLSVGSDSYTAVVSVGNKSELSVYQTTAFRGDQSIGIRSLQFQFKNGTIVNATHANLTASRGSDETTLELPARNGTVAWTSGRDGKQWGTPAFVEGSYRVELPESARVGIPFLSQVNPNPDRSTVENDQTTLYWDEVDSSISVRYYLVMDLYIFGSIALIAALFGVGGTVYYLREIRAAREKREDVGLDVEYDNDDVGDDGPPPGMR